MAEIAEKKREDAKPQRKLSPMETNGMLQAFMLVFLLFQMAIWVYAYPGQPWWTLIGPAVLYGLILQMISTSQRPVWVAAAFLALPLALTVAAVIPNRVEERHRLYLKERVTEARNDANRWARMLMLQKATVDSGDLSNDEWRDGIRASQGYLEALKELGYDWRDPLYEAARDMANDFMYRYSDDLKTDMDIWAAQLKVNPDHPVKEDEWRPTPAL